MMESVHRAGLGLVLAHYWGHKGVSGSARVLAGALLKIFSFGGV
jgi:hypothetical protein